MPAPPTPATPPALTAPLTSATAPPFTRAPSPFLHLAWLYLLITLIIFLRSTGAFVHPDLPYEDGTHMYAFYAGNPDPARILRFYAGYISLGPNIAGYAISNAAPALAPYLMAAFSLAVSGAAMTVFALRRFRCILPSDRARAAVCTAIAAMPLGNYGLTSYLTYSLWNLLLIALLLVAAPLPASRPARLVQFAFMAVAIWSHPLSVVFIPICLALLVARSAPEDRAMNAGLLAITVLYLALGIRPESPPAAAAPDLAADAALAAPVYILSRVVFETFAGSRIHSALHNRDLDVLATAAGGLLLTLAAALLPLVRARLTAVHRRALAGAASLVLALTLLTIISRNMNHESHLGGWNHRYFYIQRYTLLLAVAVAAALHLDRSPIPPRRLAIPAAAIILYIAALNALDRPFFTSPPSRTAELLRYTHRIADELGRPPADRTRGPLVFPKDGRWDIRVDPSSLPD